MTTESVFPPTPKPKWLRVKLPVGQKYTELRGLVDKYKLNTICASGSCPNMGECWGEGTATFMILGNICTRSCGFCGVKTGRPENVDWEEPEKVARSIKIMNIKHAVITSVDRDDLKDMGTIIWAETVKAIRRMNPKTTLETLIPDFQGSEKHLDKIIEVAPEVVSHNIETVRRLTREVRIQAKYDKSLAVLKYLKEQGLNRTKSGIMLGLGETEEEDGKWTAATPTWMIETDSIFSVTTSGPFPADIAQHWGPKLPILAAFSLYYRQCRVAI
jgi:lipoic acid synthetase